MGEALQMAYATAGFPSQQPEEPSAPGDPEDDQHHISGNVHWLSVDHAALIATKHLPQIYFLTSGLPYGGAGQFIDKINHFDNGRNIPVNSIAFSNASADPLVKQFGKDLANKTGGFFRSIEQA